MPHRLRKRDRLASVADELLFGSRRGSMGDQGSIYSALQDVPIMLSPQYRLPRQINIASELVPMPDPALVMVPYPFTIEKDALTDIAASREAQQKESERLSALRKAYDEERIRRQKLAARKIAPGFLDTDTRILKPEPLHSNKTAQEQEQQEEQQDTSQHENHQPQQDTTAAKVANTTDETLNANAFDYLRFEQGLAPPDPWDQPENDLMALGSILGHPRPDNAAAPPSQIPASHQYPNAYKRASSPQYPGEAVYRPAAYNGNARPQKHVYPPQAMNPARHSSPPVAPAPALPPKPFTETGSPSPTHTSPRIVASVLPGSPSTPPNAAAASPSLGYSSPTIPPPLPPHPTPHQPHEHLIDELVNMGFSRHQAAEALEKNDYDLTKATNFLLDHGVD